MSLSDSLFRCSTLGVDDCVIWWEAWAVAVAVIAVIATSFLGWMTLKVSRGANRAANAAVTASESAVKIAGDEATARLQSAKDERLMLLLWIAGEISAARGKLFRLESKLAKDGREKFENDVNLRLAAFKVISGLEFPNCEARADRLHAIGHPTAARLARGLALAKLIQRHINPDAAEEKHAPAIFKVFSDAVPRLRKDIEVVRDACVAAAKECGIKDADTDNGDK